MGPEITTFKFFAPTLLCSRDEGSGDLRIEGVASSTTRDFHGDTITVKALNKMAQSAIGMTIFMNHDYKVPQDVFGTVERARVVKTQEIDSRNGQAIHDLRFGIKVQKANPLAVQTFEQLESGTRLGLSIGAMVPDEGVTFDKSKGGRYIVDDIDLAEASVVSLPAQGRALIDYVMKAFLGDFADKPKGLQFRKDRVTAEGGDPEGVPDPLEPEEQESEGDGVEKTGIEAPADGSTAELVEEGEPGDPPAEPILEKGISHEELGLEKGKKAAEHQHPHAHVHSGEHQHGYGESVTVHSHDHAHVHSHAHGDEHDHQDTMNDYTHDHYHAGGSGDEDHAHADMVTKGFEPEIVKDQHLQLLATKVSVWDGDKVIEVDTGRSKPKGDGTQSAQDDPEDAGGDSGAGGGTTKAVTIEGPSGEEGLTLKAMMGQLGAAKAENAALKVERDAVAEAATRALDMVASVLDSVGKLPVGRKTASGQFENPDLDEAKDRLDAFSGMFDPTVMKLLKKRT